MSDTKKRTFSVLLSLILLFAFTFSSYTAYADNSPVPSSVSGMDDYLSLLGDGSLMFDKAAAAQAGYSSDAIAAVEKQIDNMNASVRNGIGYIDSQFNLIILVPGTRAVGESKVVHTWYGLTQIYLNSDEAAELKELVATYDEIAGTIADAASDIPLLNYATSASSVLLYSYYYQILMAEAAGRGIIMNIQQEFVYGGQTIWFESQ